MIERQKRETDMLGRDRGRESERGRDACEAVSQHISNEHGDMMWWRGKRALNSDGCIKYGLPLISPAINFPSFSHHILYKDKRRNTRHLKCN